MNPSEGEGNGAVGKVLLSLPITSAAPPLQHHQSKDHQGWPEAQGVHTAWKTWLRQFQERPGHLYRDGT